MVGLRAGTSAFLSTLICVICVAACSALTGAADLEVEPDGDAATADGGRDTVDASPPPEDATPPCSGFMCGTLCVALGDPVYGCAPEHACVACPGPANGTSTCSASGTCAVSCEPSFLDCNSDPADGCEVDKRSDPLHCGDCATACPAGTPYCVAGACVQICPSPLTVCGTQCVDLDTSLANCGACDKPCPAPPNGNGTPKCAQKVCSYTCSTGYADCSPSAAGCETFIKGNDPQHCGSCNACPSVPGAAPKCTTGVCGFACSSPHVDCNGTAGDGCECAVSSTNICKADKTCGACSPTKKPCNTPSDCCIAGSACKVGTCCNPSGATCTEDNECCSDKCLTGKTCQ